MEILTLENYKDRLPTWTDARSIDGHRNWHALVDIGSNGIRFSITDLTPPRTSLLQCVYKERAGISLLDALLGNAEAGVASPSLRFPPQTIELVAKTIGRFYQIAVDYYVVDPRLFTVFATEAMRRAANAAAMITAIRDACKGRLETVFILSPEVESLFGAMGARSGFVRPRGLFLDLGGGSVQMTYMNALESGSGESAYERVTARLGRSLPFGAARLIRVLEDSDSGVHLNGLAELNAGMARIFQELKQNSRALNEDVEEGKLIEIFLCGGGFRGHGSLIMQALEENQPYPIPIIGGYSVDGRIFSNTAATRKINEEYEGKIFGMSKRRRKQYPAIATVVDALARTVPNIGRVHFCAGGNREGSLLLRLPYLVGRELPWADSCTNRNHSEPIDWIDAYQVLLQGSPLGTQPEPGISDSVAEHTKDVLAFIAQTAWAGQGQDDDLMAANGLHSPLDDTRNILRSHEARALASVALVARYGGQRNLAPVHQQRYVNTRKILGDFRCHVAEYFGACAAVLTRVQKEQAGHGLYGEVEFKAKYTAPRSLEVEIGMTPGARSGTSSEEMQEIFEVLTKKDKSVPKDQRFQAHLTIVDRPETDL